MQKHDQFTAYFSQKSWKLQFTAQNCERRKKCRQAKDLNIAAIAYTPLASIILMAYYAYSAQSKTWKKCNFGTIYLKNSKKLLIYGFWCIILQAIKKHMSNYTFFSFLLVVQRNETLLSWTLRSYFNDVSNVFHCKQFHNKYFRTCTTKTLSIR